MNFNITNITHDNIRKTSLNILKSQEKLISGKRINTAGDDVAGLAVSEVMTAELRSTKKAILNIKQGFSFLKSSDGNLRQVSTMLQRMRELALQSSNGIYSQKERDSLEIEYNQLRNEIDNINKRSHLNHVPMYVDATAPLTPGMNSTDIVFVIDSTGSMSGPIGNVKANMQALADDLTAKGISFRFGLVEYKDVDGGFASVNRGWYTDATSFNSAVDSMTISGGGDVPESGLEALMDARSMGFNSTALKQMVLVTDATVKETTYTVNGVANALKADDIVTSVVADNNPSVEYNQLNHLTSETGGMYGNIYGGFSSIFSNLANQTESGLAAKNIVDLDPLRIHNGYQSEDVIYIERKNIGTTSLTIEGTNVSTEDSANYAIQKIDQAIDYISEYRGLLGGYMNRFETNENRLQEKTIIKADSISKITDTDVAFEMSELVKKQIINQSGMTLLKNIKTKNESYMQLLKA